MRSTRPPHPRCSPRARGEGFLSSLAALVDETTVDDPGHVLVHVDGPIHPEVCVGLQRVEAGVHPFEVLAGFTAPPSWTAFGIRARGRARHLDDPEAPAARTVVTHLVDRAGGEATLLRRGESTSVPPGPAVGTIPDLLRRVLGLPTAPAPASTMLLWTSIWLDRVLERWGRPDRRHELTSSWGQLAVLHPAIHAPSPRDVVAFADPASLVAVARSHAASSSWSELRRSPVPLALPDGPVPRRIATWMDDGFFARWTIGAFPSAATLAGDLRQLLGEPLGPTLVETTLALLD
jgi:hypothetical protein